MKYRRQFPIIITLTYNAQSSPWGSLPAGAADSSKPWATDVRTEMRKSIDDGIFINNSFHAYIQLRLKLTVRGTLSRI